MPTDARQDEIFNGVLAALFRVTNDPDIRRVVDLDSELRSCALLNLRSDEAAFCSALSDLFGSCGLEVDSQTLAGWRTVRDAVRWIRAWQDQRRNAAVTV